MELAEASKAAVIQIATWNDYGEGTGIEPTKIGGYARLESVSRFCGSQYSRADFQLSADVYLARVNSPSAAGTEELNKITPLMLEGYIKSASKRFSVLSNVQI